MAIFIIQIGHGLSAVGIIVDLVWLQFSHIIYVSFGELHMCFIVGAINYHVYVLFIAYSVSWH